MGADLLLQFVPISHAGAAELKARVDRISERDLIGIGEDAGIYDAEGMITASGVWAQLLVDVEFYLRCASRRDVSLFGEWYVTGGMSWGDDPTEAFAPFCRLATAGVTDDRLWSEVAS